MSRFFAAITVKKMNLVTGIIGHKNQLRIHKIENYLT